MQLSKIALIGPPNQGAATESQEDGSALEVNPAGQADVSQEGGAQPSAEAPAFNPQPDPFSQLYNILVRLTFENKRLAKEQSDNETHLLDLQKKTEAKQRALTGDSKNLEKTIEQLQDLKMKNQMMQKSNEDIETKIQERKKEQSTVFENTVDSIIKKINEFKPKAGKEAAQLDAIKD